MLWSYLVCFPPLLSVRMFLIYWVVLCGERLSWLACLMWGVHFLLLSLECVNVSIVLVISTRRSRTSYLFAYLAIVFLRGVHTNRFCLSTWPRGQPQPWYKKKHQQYFVLFHNIGPSRYGFDINIWVRRCFYTIPEETSLKIYLRKSICYLEFIYFWTWTT